MGILSELRYENYDDVVARVNRTIIRYQGVPVYSTVHSNGRTNEPDLSLDLTDFHRDVSFNKVHSSDEDIDVSAMPLGYVNKATSAVMAVRLPTRRHRQGLCNENLAYIDPRHERTRGIIPAKAQDIVAKDFFRMLNNEYPTGAEAIECLEHRNEVSSVAFHRKFAIVRDDIGVIKLHFFGAPLAVYNEDKGTFKLTSRMKHYAPVLEQFEIPIEVR